MILTAPASASESFRIVEQPAPVSSTWRYRAKVMAHYSLSNYAYCGFTLRNSVNGRLIYFGLTYVGGHFLYAQRWNSPTSFAVNIAGIGIAPSGFVPIYLEVENTGTNLVLRYSHHGYDGTFHTHSTEPIATFITNAPDFIGLTANSQNSNIVRTCVDWFRRMA